MRGVPCVRRRARDRSMARDSTRVSDLRKSFRSLGRFRENVLLLLLLLLLRRGRGPFGHGDVLSLVFVNISIRKSTIPIGHGLDMGSLCSSHHYFYKVFVKVTCKSYLNYSYV